MGRCPLVSAQPGAVRPPVAAGPAYRFGPFLFELGDLADPAGVAVDPDGCIYVADAGSHHVRVFDRMGQPLRAWGGFGHDLGRMVRPSALAVAEDGSVYVVDTGNHRIQVFDGAGAFLREWGRFGRGTGQFNRPGGVAVDGDRVYVADEGNCRVQVFDRSGGFVLAFGECGRESGRFNRPVDVTVAPDGNLFVADADNSRVQRFDRTGRFIAEWGDWGPYLGLLAAPTGVHFHQHEIYVADSGNHRIQVFDSSGSPRYQWGVHALLPREGAGKLHYPTRLAIAPDGAFAVVCESFANRCQTFAAYTTSAPATGYDETIIEVDAFSHYGQHCHLAGDVLAITEPDTHSVLVFNNSGSTPILVNRFGGYGTGFGKFIRPAAVHYSASDSRLYVADAGNRRLQVFSLEVESLKEVRYDPLLTRFVKSLDMAAVAAALGKDVLPWVPAPQGVARHEDGRVHLLDSRNAAVIMLDAHLSPLSAWGGFGREPGRFGDPTSLAFSRSGEVLFVVDADGHRVQAFDREGAFLFAWGRRGSGPGDFDRPFGVAAGIDGSVYVTDMGAHRIQKFDEAGRFVREWGAPGLGPGELFRPAGLVQDGVGRLIVMDFGNHRGVTFSPEGEFLDAFGARLYVMPAKVKGKT